MKSSIGELSRLVLCKVFGHSWVVRLRRGGIVRLWYTDRTCARCGKRQMQDKFGQWREPFYLANDWERMDFESGEDV